jgi:CRISPR-associated protein Csd1
MIKNVPAGQSSGSSLISYNKDAFESYGLSSNENSSVCTACARNYVEGLNYLLGNGELQQPEKGKPYFRYSNRKKIASDTAMVYWTKSSVPTPEIDFVDSPMEHEKSIKELLFSEQPSLSEETEEDLELLLQGPYRGKTAPLKSVDVDRFYSCMLSGAAARIAVRTWIEATTSAIKEHIAAWFHDTAGIEYNFDNGEKRFHFFPLRVLANSCGVYRKKDTGGKTDFKLDDQDDFPGRAATMLWHCALLGESPPLTLLDRVMRRIKMEEGRVTAARAALLRLILNRNNYLQQTGGRRMQYKLDPENMNTAYMAGRIFAVLESIQIAALGKDLNAPIRDRFFSSASTTPASAFGRLLKMSQNHLAKLRGEKPGLAVNLDKQLGELFTHLEAFPVTITLEEQGQFAIGYYHQRQENFVKRDAQPDKGEDHVRDN